MSGSLSTSAARPKVKHSTENILFGVDFSKLLQAGETLTGTPSVSQPSGLSVSGSPLVNTAPFTNDDGATVAIGNGVQVRISGGTSPTDYVLTCTCGTSAGNTRTVVCTLQVRDT
jgi:hypothetical protein